MYCSWPECRLPSYSRCSAAGTAQTGIRRCSFHSRVALGVPNQAFWHLTSFGVKCKNRSKHRYLHGLLALGERISLQCFVKHPDKTYCKLWRFLLFNHFQFSKLTDKQTTLVFSFWRFCGGSHNFQKQGSLERTFRPFSGAWSTPAKDSKKWTFLRKHKFWEWEKTKNAVNSASFKPKSFSSIHEIHSNWTFNF